MYSESLALKAKWMTAETLGISGAPSGSILLHNDLPDTLRMVDIRVNLASN